MNVEDKVCQVRDLIEKSKNPLMFFDTDTDGICSYFQLKKSFSQIKKGFPLSKTQESSDAAIKELRDENDLIIFFDTPYVSSEIFEAIGKRKVVLVDHHPTDIAKSLKNYDIVYLNPLEYNENDGRCSSFWAYKITGMKENLFYVTLASVADFYLLDVIREMYDYDKVSFNLLFRISDKKRAELFDFLDKYSFDDKSVDEIRFEWIQYLIYECNLIIFKNFFDFIFKFENDKVIKGISIVEKLSLIDLKTEISAGKGFLFEDYDLMMKKYSRYIKKALTSRETDLVYFEHKGNTSFNRQISEELAYKLKKYKVIFVSFKKYGKENYSCSFRGRNYKVNDLIKEALQGLAGQGGGHPFAAGAYVSQSDFPIFKKRIFAKFDL